jgi:outer membrane murein-binding lipoprotein Lpp
MTNTQKKDEFLSQVELLKKQRDQIEEAIEATYARIDSLEES